MQFAIDDLHDHLITIGQSKFAADVSRELQPSATDEAPFVHVHCIILWDATE
ncbi:hypothetical protein [Porphyrobacter sp. AAP60]|uniref:hypothetical protein n=1 Tax=Porphyrobacter sp. AAP60 TaxID=1523423 RepID=UPI001F371B8F|nr:hypothetical protein [Porphyrobacter sp. AAP60]